MWKKITTIIILIVVIVVIVVIGFFSNKDPKVNESQNNQEEEQSDFLETLTVKYQYKDGVHTFVGNLELPNPCYTYNAEITDTEDPDTKNLMVTYVETEDEICAQVITNATYRVSYTGPQDLNFKAFVNGEERRLNPFEIPDDMDIDDFELFIKG